MSDGKPSVYGYEFGMRCACGGDILTNGCSRKGPAPDYELAHDRKSQSVTEGEYKCDWCGTVWKVSFDRAEE